MDQDTAPQQVARYHELLRALEPWQKLRVTAALSTGIRTMAEAGLRQRHPAACEDEIRIRLIVRLYGRAVAERLFHRRVPADAV